MAAARFEPTSVISRDYFRGTIWPREDDLNGDLQRLQSAMVMKGMVKKEIPPENLIPLFARRTARQRVHLLLQFNVSLNRDLQAELEKGLSGDFLKGMRFLTRTLLELDLATLQSKEELDWVDVIVPKTNHEIRQLRKMINVEELVRNCKSSFLAHLFTFRLSAEKQEPSLQARWPRQLPKQVEGRLLEEDLQRLLTDYFTEQQKRAGLPRFAGLLAARSTWHLTRLLQAFERKQSENFYRWIEEQSPKELKAVVVASAKCSIQKEFYFAERLVASMKGVGTNEELLARLIVARSEIDLMDIKTAFNIITGETLEKWIKGDTSGAFRALLLALCA